MDKVEIPTFRCVTCGKDKKAVCANCMEFPEDITAAHDAGWVEGVEAAANRAASSKYSSEPIELAIRRLRKGK